MQALERRTVASSFVARRSRRPPSGCRGRTAERKSSRSSRAVECPDSATGCCRKNDPVAWSQQLGLELEVGRILDRGLPIIVQVYPPPFPPTQPQNHACRFEEIFKTKLQASGAQILKPCDLKTTGNSKSDSYISQRLASCSRPTIEVGRPSKVLSRAMQLDGASLRKNRFLLYGCLKGNALPCRNTASTCSGSCRSCTSRRQLSLIP